MRVKNKGFTLIELMIVLAIIAVLAAVAIPLYDAYKRRAIRAEAEEELMNIATIEEDYFNSYRRYSIDEKEIREYYGAKAGAVDEGYGDHFQIDLQGTTAAYTAVAYVCYNKPGKDCNSGNKDMTCTITAGQEKPACIE